jgi:hypothetical protein
MILKFDIYCKKTKFKDKILRIKSASFSTSSAEIDSKKYLRRQINPNTIKSRTFLHLKIISIKKGSISGAFSVNYACPAGPKLSGIGGCSVSLISPCASSKR